MRIIDSLVKLVLGIGIVTILLTGAVMIYILAMLMLIYKGIRGKVNFNKEFQELNNSFIELIKYYIFS